MFEKASRMKLRFEFMGQISTEDLWDLSVEVLDELYGKLRMQQKNSNEDSLLKKKSKESEILNLRINLVKHVVETRLNEAEARMASAQIKLQKEKISTIIQKKRDEGLENMSIEELQEEMDKLTG